MTPRIQRILRTLACVAVLSCASVSAAQDSRAYVGAAMTITQWGSAPIDAGTPSTSFGNSSADTSLRGMVVEAGWIMNPRWAFGVELSQPFRRSELLTTYGYFSPSRTISRYRENVVFATARARLGAWGPMRAVAMAGAGIVRGSALQRVSLGRFGSSVFGPFGDEREVKGQTTAVTFGGELIAAAGAHVSVVPQLRMIIVQRGTLLGRNRFTTLGLRRNLLRGGIGIRVAF